MALRLRLHLWLLRYFPHRSANITFLLHELDRSTKLLFTEDLEALQRSGILPTGICDWLVALRKADAAIPCKHPRPHLRSAPPKGDSK